jgi:tetratricopeptide (TPR) repeat protein
MKKSFLLLTVLILGIPFISEAQKIKKIVRTADEFYTRGNYSDALIQYSSAIELKPDEANLYYKRGLVYEMSGDFQKAAEDYDRSGVFDKKILMYFMMLRECILKQVTIALLSKGRPMPYG